MHSELSLFVYGSMSEGMVHFNKVHQYIVECEAAQVRGAAYRLPVGYPVFMQDTSDGADWVHGQWLRMQAPELIFKLLDEFHGFSPLIIEKSLFFKESIEVEKATGRVSAMVYAINPTKLPKGSTRVLHGDWRKDLAAQPALTQTLTERQALYVKRLNSTTGREIVPIDLELYREMMKLDLIVDKGRRLALSPLGKQVARYLPE